MTPHDLTLALLRTTLVTSAAACVATILLSWLKVDSPRTHRIAWLLVVAQGWLLIPFPLEIESSLEIETLPPPLPPAVRVVESGGMPSSAQVWAPPVDMMPLPPRAMPTSAWACPLAVAAWLLGAIALALFAGARYATIARSLPGGEVPDDPQWQHEWRRALNQQCHAHVRVGMRTLMKHMLTRTRACHPNSSSSPRVPCFRPRKHASIPRIDFRLTANLGPLVAFIPWQYLLLAPRSLWTALTSSERTVILRHELAHIRRRDLWKSLAFRVLALPQWFNPLVWLAARRFDEAAEWHCDRAAACGLARKSSAHVLARNSMPIASALLRTAELATPKRPPRTLGFLAAIPNPNLRTALTRRIQRLVTPRLKEESRMKRLAIPALLIAIAAAQLIRIEHVAAENPPTFSRDAESSERSAPHAAPPTLSELRPHDVITVLVDYGRPKGGERTTVAGKHRERVNFEIACEIVKILPNGNLSIEGHQTILKDGKEQRISLTGEVHPEVIQPDRTVSSSRVAELKIDIENHNIDKLVQPASAAEQRTGVIRVDISETGGPQATSLPNETMDIRDRKARERRLLARSVFRADPVVSGTRPEIAPSARDTVSQAAAVVPPPSDETQAILDEAKAAREAGDRNREFAALAKLPYVIEPPDILDVAYWGRVKSETEEWTTGADHCQCLVAMDGTISGEPFSGPVHVAGLTLEEAQAAIRKQLPEPLRISTLGTRMIGYNSKVAYVSTKNGGAGDDVVRVAVEYPLSADNNVGKLLKTVYGLKGIPTGAKITLCAAGVKEDDARKIIWDAATSAPTAETNYPLLPGDRIFVVLPATATPAYAPTPAHGSQPAAAYAPQPAPALPSDLVRIEYAWNGASGPRRSYASSALARGDTVGRLMSRMLRRDHRLHGSMLDQIAGIPEEFSGADILVSRGGDPSQDEGQGWFLRWDDAAGRIVTGENIELKPGDKLRVDLLDVKVSATPIPEGVPVVGVVHRREDGLVRPQFVRFEVGQTVADVIAAADLPQSLDFAKARLDLYKQDPASPGVDKGSFMPIVWEGDRPTKETNHAVTPGSQLDIDFCAPRTPAQPFPAGEPPLVLGTSERELSNNINAERPQQVAYDITLLEDISGDLAEFIEAGNAGAVRQTAALKPALAVLSKHGLAKTVSRPQLVATAGEPAEFNLGAEVPNKDWLFRNATHVKIVGHVANAIAYTAVGPQNEPPALSVKIEAHADHADERHTLDAEFTIPPGQSAIARLKAKEGSDSPLYLVVTPEWLD
jgi:protein involved in polysaccharide export with SLBB domain